MFKRMLLTAFAVLTGLGSAMAANGDAVGVVREDQAMPSAILRQDVDYSVYLPPEYDRRVRSYPVIFMMHGVGGRSEDWFQFARANLIFDKLIESGKVPPFIAVSPEGRRDPKDSFNTYYMNDADGAFRWQDMFVREFVPFVEKRYGGLGTKNGRAIIGLSMGGYAATALSLKYPDLFVGAAALSAAFRTEDQITALDQTAYDWRYGKAWGIGLAGKARINKLYRANSVFDLASEVPGKNLEKTSFYFDCGSDDDFFAGNAAFHLQLRKLGVKHRFMVREGGHDWTYWGDGLPEATRFIGALFQKGMSPEALKPSKPASDLVASSDEDQPKRQPSGRPTLAPIEAKTVGSQKPKGIKGAGS
ncbi:esterase family protein [Mesorhizobium sp. RP14(2022)]|uniref:Esterase family protein n=1 Tax=Mesorhizobium liriopis TaxID=2953882 RepID=A0ABT1C4J1_9HYPH|nr:alpha/beta hydrolase-fold protein [Mesorhizobium liriopis]MCO6049749.1 esterase family protein [Mesorhizobium liriopis]